MHRYDARQFSDAAVILTSAGARTDTRGAADRPSPGGQKGKGRGRTPALITLRLVTRSVGGVLQHADRRALNGGPGLVQAHNDVACPAEL